MFAIVDIAGEQFKVQENQEISTPRLEQEEGATIELANVLLLSMDNNTKIGTPYIDGAKIEATILGHGKDKKVIVFKKKRRKNYKVLNGHRQPRTRVKIGKIMA